MSRCHLKLQSSVHIPPLIWPSRLILTLKWAHVHSISTWILTFGSTLRNWRPISHYYLQHGYLMLFLMFWYSYYDCYIIWFITCISFFANLNKITISKSSFHSYQQTMLSQECFTRSSNPLQCEWCSYCQDVHLHPIQSAMLAAPQVFSAPRAPSRTKVFLFFFFVFFFLIN